MEIKVLGTGCPKCKAPEKAAQEVVRELGIDAVIGKEEDIMKIMKRLNFFIVMILALSINFSCSAQSENNNSKQTVSEAGDIEMYYFHYTRRCITCKVVEATANEAVIDLYGDRVPFVSLNLEDAQGARKAQELGISGQTLVIVKGNTKINITNEGFMYARSNPEKFKQVISEKITSLL